MTAKERSAVRTSTPESANSEWVSIGKRLVLARGGRSQGDQAVRLGVHKNTYARWERGEREIGADGLRKLLDEGHNPVWLLTGQGSPSADLVFDGAVVLEANPSQPLSEPAFNIAWELADEACREAGVEKPVRFLFVKLVALLYEGITQGLPVADVRRIGFSTAQEFFTGAIIDDSKQEVGKSGPQRHGGHRGGKQEAG